MPQTVAIYFPTLKDLLISVFALLSFCEFQMLIQTIAMLEFLNAQMTFGFAARVISLNMKV